MYLQHTTTLHGVVLEQHLREHPIVTFLIVVGTLIDHSSVAGADHKVIGDIHAVIAQLHLQNLIQFNEIDTLVQRTVAGCVENGVDNLLYQLLLCGIAHVHDFFQ